eukprot:TRINITY_DN10614_c0_g1_i1.p1 TRINITY_DN10614_c0_g1~~TRINITY_DN10614_c0_g1_i1.p1  ORF type:complete len:113 (-),score=19.07 TRINITY_DN10614_c0_g1_i1:183-521(-)
MADTFCHIAQAAEWELAKRKGGDYVVDSLASEGFIHCSDREQVADTLVRHFKGRDDLTILTIDPTKLPSTSVVKVEDLYGHGAYPHVYGPINVEAIVKEEDLALFRKPDGSQ